jgi:hypothetical protein
MSKLKEDRKLVNEEPLLVLPSLAKALGLNEAIILQQIHYWLTINEGKGSNFKDGYYWTFNSSGGWQKQFPFWSKKTIERVLRNVENKGIVVTGCYNKLSFDRTKWYRLDYAKLIEVCPLDNNDQIQWTEKVHSFSQNDLTGEATQWDKMTSPIPETNLNRLTSENTLLIKDEDCSGSGFLEKPSPSLSSIGKGVVLSDKRTVLSKQNSSFLAYQGRKKRIYTYLLSKGNEGATVQEIVYHIGVTSKNEVQHVRNAITQLKKSGLVAPGQNRGHWLVSKSVPATPDSPALERQHDSLESHSNTSGIEHTKCSKCGNERNITYFTFDGAPVCEACHKVQVQPVSVSPYLGKLSYERGKRN